MIPYWPIPVTISVILLIWAIPLHLWRVPLVVVCGYVCARLVMNYAPSETQEVALGFVWVVAALAMAKLGGYIPALAFCLSGLTYPVLLFFGFRINYLELSPVIAELFAVVALASIGGGLYGYGNNHSGALGRGFNPWLSDYSVGVSKG